MTAFARSDDADLITEELSWELRSINHRFLDLSIRLPEELRSLEPAVRERLQQNVQRGKIECTLRYIKNRSQQMAPNINQPLLQQLLSAATTIDAQLPHHGVYNIVELLRWPGLLIDPKPDYDALSTRALHVLDCAITDLIAARQREGQRLQCFIEQRSDSLQQLIKQVRERLPNMLLESKQRLQQRCMELSGECDPARLEQEIVLLAQRSDTAEELDRLTAHLQEIQETLTTTGPIGRRLDFLMQELNREANTLTSKSPDTIVTRAAVDMKVLIEQMREQIQNLE
jgi:uncharacterized protein (TIGR00255 family)